MLSYKLITSKWHANLAAASCPPRFPSSSHQLSRLGAGSARFSSFPWNFSAMSRSAVDFESLPQGMLFMNAALVLLLGHFSLTKSDLCAAFRSCFHQRPPPEPCEGPGLDQQQRYEEDLLKKRVEMIALQNKIAVHWALIFVCSSLWMLMQYSDLGSFCVFLGSLLIYVMHAFASQGRINTKAFVECWMFAKFMAHALVTLSVLKETDLVRLVSVENCLVVLSLFDFSIFSPKIGRMIRLPFFCRRPSQFTGKTLPKWGALLFGCFSGLEGLLATACDPISGLCL